MCEFLRLLLGAAVSTLVACLMAWLWDGVPRDPPLCFTQKENMCMDTDVYIHMHKYLQELERKPRLGKLHE